MEERITSLIIITMVDCPLDHAVQWIQYVHFITLSVLQIYLLNMTKLTLILTFYLELTVIHILHNKNIYMYCVVCFKKLLCTKKWDISKNEVLFSWIITLHKKQVIWRIFVLLRCVCRDILRYVDIYTEIYRTCCCFFFSFISNLTSKIVV